MNLPEAIKVNTALAKELDVPQRAKEKKAVELGIEALKWRQLMETDYGSWCGPPLPGETEGTGK